MPIKTEIKKNFSAEKKKQKKNGKMSITKNPLSQMPIWCVALLTNG